MSSQQHALRLASDEIYWRCDPEIFDFETTADVDAASDVLGQDTAREALEFGIECLARGQNIYVRGAAGTGRKRMIHQILSKLNPSSKNKKDYCYVHNFGRPHQPRLITLPSGMAPDFRLKMTEFAGFATSGLAKALDSEPLHSERVALQKSLQDAVDAVSKSLKDDLAANGMALVTMQNGPVNQTAIFPVVDGKPVAPQQLQTMIAEGTASSEQWAAYEKAMPPFREKMAAIGKQAAEQFKLGAIEMRDWVKNAVMVLLKEIVDPIRASFDVPAVKLFLDEVVNNVIEVCLQGNTGEQAVDFSALYGVNIVLTQSNSESRPVVVEGAPSMMNLLGTVEPKLSGGMAVSDFRGINAGALLRADQGYLVLDVDDVLAEPGAWRALIKTLRTGCLEIVPPELGWMRQQVILQPEPIKVQVRVILVGNIQTYYMLDHNDPDFMDMFKVLADFESELARSDEAAQQYASVIAHVCREEELSHFHKSGVAALAEHGSRIVARNNKLTARFGRIADIVREAAFLAGDETVMAEHVHHAIRRTKLRANMPSRKFQEMIEAGTIMVQTTGEVVGQINGLAVMKSGQLSYGFPARITATIGPGRAGLINIEGRANMSGSIHTKGFHIIGGLLRHLLRLPHPMAFSASLAFEQSYGGIDGDSASGAEIVCLLSALTGVPVKQNMAMTGAIDQHGHLEAIGGANEKIEGYFDVCSHFGLTGDQGVVIPKSNAGDLQLRQDVVEACDAGTFHIYAVESITDAIELMTGQQAGEYKNGQYTDGSVMATAVQQATQFWQQTLASPAQLTKTDTETESDEDEAAIA